MSPSAGGQSADKPLSKSQLAALLASAKAAADRRKLAAHCRAVAAQHELVAREHGELAAK